MAQREIKVVPYDEEWPMTYKKEAARIIQALKPVLSAIHHAGSTAIPGISAKPTIDIVAEVKELDTIDDYNEKLSMIGYEALGEYGIKGRRYFVKTDGLANHLVHLHIFETESEDVVRHLAFRDYLKAHEDDAVFYSQLKQTLAEQFRYDSESYCEGKNEACKRIEQLALQWWYGA